MSDYNNAIAAMIAVAGGIVPERSFIDIRNSADRALKHWIQDIVNQPERAVPEKIERRSTSRAKGPAFKRLQPVETFPEICG